MARGPRPADLSRRERQIMDALFELRRATAAEIHVRMPDPPTLTAVRTMIRILEDKGHIVHDVEGRRHLYSPATPARHAQTSAMRHILRTFFGGSKRAAVAALLDADDRGLSPDERREVLALIRNARARGQ